jgi:hypothetical protein
MSPPVGAAPFPANQLDEPCDLHRAHVSLLELGGINITVNAARQIAHSLEISLPDLLLGLI